ncbi:MAG: carbohydrate ABC transporter permease [Anaerolineae bacterium]
MDTLANTNRLGARVGRIRQSAYRNLVFRRSIYGFLFVLPALLFFLAFNLYPTINGFYLSLTEYSLLKPPRWVGLANYGMLPNDNLFRQALGVSAIFVLGSVIPKAILSLVVALAFTRSFRGRNWFKAMYFTPTLLSGVVVSLVWRLLADPQGLLNVVLSPLTQGRQMFWLADSRLSPALVIAVDNWAGIPFYMMIWIAGLVGIPREFYEAAIIDGAGRLQGFLHVTLPLLKPTALFVLVISSIGAFQAFTLQYVMTKGGPNNQTTTVALLVYKYAFNYYRMGSAAAVSVIMFLIIIVLTVIQIRLVRSEQTSYV